METASYISLKLFKKGSDDDFYIDERITLTVQEFQEIINNVENISMGLLRTCRRNRCLAHSKDQTRQLHRHLQEKLVNVKLIQFCFKCDEFSINI